MKIYWLITIWGISATSVLAVESAENLASHFTSRPLQEQTMKNLPKGREQEVFNAILARQSVYLGTLLRLNHAPTVERVMSEFAAIKGESLYLRQRIERSGSPYIIDELAPALYKEDLIYMRPYGGEGGRDWGQSAQAAEIIGQLIIRAPEFPPEVKEWAKMHLGGPGPSIIQAGRAWWELNQAALLANQFDKVQVPASYPAGVMPEEPAQQLAAPPAAIEPAPEPPAPTPPPPEPTPEPVKSSVAASMPTPAVAPEPAAKTGPVWWIVGLIILAAGVVFVARKKWPRE